jgi:hypothetical protein
MICFLVSAKCPGEVCFGGHLKQLAGQFRPHGLAVRNHLLQPNLAGAWSPTAAIGRHL